MGDIVQVVNEEISFKRVNLECMGSIPLRVQHLEAERGRPRTSKHQSHYPGTVNTSDKVLSEYLGQEKPDGEEQLELSWEDKPLHGTYHIPHLAVVHGTMAHTTNRH